MKIGLFFGSFNPIHVGHLIIANYMATRTDLKQVWLVVSPQNPLKPKNTLAIEDNPLLKASDVEFKLPIPSYTIDTLAHLKDKYPQHEFALIMGSDNITTIHKWKNYEKLLSDYDIYVYRRPQYEVSQQDSFSRVKLFDAPLMDISATYIRESLKNGQSIQYLVPDKVLEYLMSAKLY
jgi:nicotinate-nucleotide adenylyltransferase